MVYGGKLIPYSAQIDSHQPACLQYQLRGGKTCVSTWLHVSPQSPLPSCYLGRSSSSGEHRVHCGYLSTTVHSWASINFIFGYPDPFSNCIINSCLWHCVCGAPGKNITVFVHENQSFLSSSRSYTKQTKLSLDGLDHMPWRKCTADVWEIDKAEGGKSPPVGDKWFCWEHAPGGNVVSWDTATHPKSTKTMAKNTHFSTHRHTKPQPETSVAGSFFFFFFYKKLGSETLESKRRIFSPYLSLSISITVDILMQTIKFSSWRKASKESKIKIK